MRFLDIRTDFAFKKVFGAEDSKVRLISFLNSVIRFEADARIADLTIVDPYNIPMLKGMKDSFVDVKAVLDNGSKVIIEMQVLAHTGFEKRVLYNAAKNYSMQLMESEKYHLLNPIIALTIVDFVMFEDSDKLISNFKLLEKEEFIDYSDDLELIFIELPKFTKSLDELQNIQDQWLYFIKNAGSLEYVPENISSEVASAFDISNTASMSEKELELQYKKKEFIAVQKAILEDRELAVQQALERGMEKGREEGMEKGSRETQLVMAKKLLHLGMDAEQVSAVTGLTLAVVVQLKHNP